MTKTKLEYTLRKPAHVDIYDGKYVAYVARIYADKIVLMTPCVRWDGNSGTYDVAKTVIRELRVIDAVRQDLRDDAEDSAWAAIGRAEQDAYLAMQGR